LDLHKSALDLHERPWKEHKPCNVVLGDGGRQRGQNSGEVLAGEGRGRGGAGPRGHVRPIYDRSWGQAAPEKGAPRHGCALAVVDGSAGEVVAWPGNARLGELPGTSGEAPRWLGGWEIRPAG
jgi:hypothetical protein